MGNFKAAPVLGGFKITRISSLQKKNRSSMLRV
jgi:hypothetical protein